MAKILPVPRHIEEEERKITLKPFYKVADHGEFDLKASIRTFVDYADRAFSVIFTEGDGGITINIDPELPKSAYAIKAVEEGVEIRAGDTEALAYAFASLLLAIEKLDGELVLPALTITDAPKGNWRGLMIDLARKWHPINYLYDVVDLCWLYKINRLQLHFTDDQSYTLPCKAYPKLSTKNRHYSYAELEAFREYAASRSVTLVPEIDMPGHCSQFCEKYPEIFGNHGIMCVSEECFAALKTILEELIEIFPDSPYIHLGGDEAAINRWNECEKCKAYRIENSLENVHALYADFLRRVTNMVLEMGRTPIIWEGFSKEYNDMISKDVIVIGWESYYQLAPSLIEAGFTVINCSWKPLYILAPVRYWSREEILDWNIYTWRHWLDISIACKHDITVPETSPVLGGQICVWGDWLMALPSNEEACRAEFPLVAERVPALAEKTWNIDSTLTIDELEEKYSHTSSVLTALIRK